MDQTVDGFVRLFETMGFRRAEHDRPEPELEKVAIYADENSVPTHTARLQENGRWTSKLGKDVDIEHELAGLEGTTYGRVQVVLMRRVGKELD